jgi:heme b synthase
MITMKNAPRLIAWELTAGCNLNCVHCRGASTSSVPAGELTTDEAKHFIDEVSGLGKPILILSGGEPLTRPDVFEIALYGTDSGFRIVLATNGTLLTPEIVGKLKEAGVQRLSISIDGTAAKSHDEFRGRSGAFERTLTGIEVLRKADFPFQINTMISSRNLEEIPRTFELAKKLGAVAYHIFFLVPTGRGEESDEVSPEDYESILNWLYDMQKESKILLKATCAPHYFRVMRQRAKKEGIEISVNTHGYETMTKGCLGGTGFCFVSSVGDVYPCGYLPVLAGNIRKQPFRDIWKNSEIFRKLRDPEELKGKCGICEYKKVCSGCRARAYAATGDYLNEEPYCVYSPGKK